LSETPNQFNYPKSLGNITPPYKISAKFNCFLNRDYFLKLIPTQPSEFFDEQIEEKSERAKLIYEFLPSQKLVPIRIFCIHLNITYGGWPTSQKYVQNPLVPRGTFFGF
jgi:hypothetical protein